MKVAINRPRTEWALAAVIACACSGTLAQRSSAIPARASTAAASAAGANEYPQARLHLKLAHQHIATADRLLEDGEIEAALLFLQRAEADAKLSLALAREERLTMAAARAQQKTDELSRRVASERALLEAPSGLEGVGYVRKEPGATVVTLDGSALFAGDGAILVPTARVKVRPIVRMLKRDGNQEPVIIQSHLPSRGFGQPNFALSQQRANAVRDYLIDQGVPRSRLQAAGVAPERSASGEDSGVRSKNVGHVQIIISNPSAQ